jgi:hypothetical protein
MGMWSNLSWPHLQQIRLKAGDMLHKGVRHKGMRHKGMRHNGMGHNG